MKASRRAVLRCAFAACLRTAEPVYTPDPPQSAETEAEQAFPVLQRKILQSDDEETGKQRVVQAQEGREAEREMPDSFALLAGNE